VHAPSLILAALGQVVTLGYDRFGMQLEQVGDLDGDGIFEVLVSDPEFRSTAGKTAVGAIWLYDPAKNVAIRRWIGEQPGDGDRFGDRLVIAPDLDGDRISDFLTWGTRETREGTLVAWQVFSTVTGTCLHRGEKSVDRRYMSMHLLPDTSKSEIAEARLLSVIVDPMKHEVGVQVSRLAKGEESWATGFPSPRTVVVWAGVLAGDPISRAEWSALVVGREGADRDWPLLPDADTWCPPAVRLVTSSGSSVEIDFGRDACKDASLAFRALGGVDLDGDLVRDWIVANPGRRAADGWLAAVSGSDGKLLWRTPSGALTANARSLCWTADEDEDGLAEVVVGSPGTTDTDMGMCVISAKNGAPRRTIAWTDTEGKSTTYLGSALCSIGDVDGDGAHDLLAAAISPGGWRGNANVIRIVSGRSGATMRVVSRSTLEPMPKGR